jgi:hypothetical protein
VRFGSKMVRFESVNGRYEKFDGDDFILISLHLGSKFSKKKKKPKQFKILEGRLNVLLYTYLFFNNIYNLFFNLIFYY